MPILAFGQCYDASLSNLTLTPSDPAILNQPLTIEFTFCNDLEALPDDDLQIVFTPNKLTQTGPPTGDAAIYFDWFYFFGTWTGTQKAEIPAGICFQVTTTYIVSEASDMASPQVGTSVNIQPSGIMSGTNTGTCEGDPPTACFCVEDDNISMFTWTEEILPVKLSSFEVIKQRNTSLIVWETTSEVNTDYFDVERSPNGQSFQRIDQVKSAGRSNDLKHYQTVDQNPFIGKNYYRLKMVDLDGKTEYSQIRSVEFSEPGRNFSIYPNPANEYIYIGSPELDGEQHTLELLNEQGKLLMTNQVSASKKVDLNSLLPGLYIVRILNKEGKLIQSERFIKADL